MHNYFFFKFQRLGSCIILLNDLQYFHIYDYNVHFADSTFFCISVNLLLGLVTMFHLAYLGMMFDSSSQMQEKGYSAAHTLRKWSALNYSSHWVAFSMYVLMAVL